jgi:hypothetical protein
MRRLGKSFRPTLLALTLGSVLCLFPTLPSFAQPARIIILRHSEKLNAYALCDLGQERALALQAQYLGKAATDSLFPAGDPPAAFFAITLHTLETVAPAASSWGLPVVDFAVVPQPKAAGKHAKKVAETIALNQQTRLAVEEVITDPRWDGKTVVMAWEHDHIANPDLPSDDTLRGLLKLNQLPGEPVSTSWPGSNYDYFWIIDYQPGSDVPVRFSTKLQVFTGPFGNLPDNAWDTPEPRPAGNICLP